MPNNKQLSKLRTIIYFKNAENEIRIGGMEKINQKRGYLHTKNG
jgi:hypothetical protein